MQSANLFEQLEWFDQHLKSSAVDKEVGLTTPSATLAPDLPWTHTYILHSECRAGQGYTGGMLLLGMEGRPAIAGPYYKIARL